MAQLLILLAIALPFMGLAVRFAGGLFGLAVGIILAPFALVMAAKKYRRKRA